MVLVSLICFMLSLLLMRLMNGFRSCGFLIVIMSFGSGRCICSFLVLCSEDVVEYMLWIWFIVVIRLVFDGSRLGVG